MLHGVKHLFFDLDHTLWDFEKNSQEAMVEIYAELKLKEALGTDFIDFFSVYKEYNEQLWGFYKKGEVDRETVRNERFVKSFAHFNCNNEPLALKASELYVQISPYKTSLFAGAIETLLQLQSERYCLHIITNGFNEVQFIKLKNSGLQSFFNTVTTSEMAGANKPSPGIFSHALRQAGALAEHSIMIGDSEEADISGANMMGIKSVLFDPYNLNPVSEANYRINTLNELLALLKS